MISQSSQVLSRKNTAESIAEHGSPLRGLPFVPVDTSPVVPVGMPEAVADLAASSAASAHGPARVDRDLSWLEFNRRVLKEALDERTPLLERVKFLAIFSSNLDEFFQKRIALIRPAPGDESATAQ